MSAKPVRLTVMHAPNKVTALNSRIVHRMVVAAYKHRVDTIGPTEVFRAIGALRRRMRYRLLVAGSARSAHDTPILIRRFYRKKRVTYVSTVAGKAIAGRGGRWGERRVNHVRYHKDGIGWITHVTLHPSTILDYRKAAKIPEWAAGQYDQTMTVLDQVVAEAIKRGDTVVVTGDMNTGPQGERDHTKPWITPGHVMAKHGLKHWRHGIDWVLYSPHLRLVAKTVIEPKDQGKGQDHPWLIAGFEVER